jgi:hypothetical protein
MMFDCNLTTGIKGFGDFVWNMKVDEILGFAYFILGLFRC